LFFDLISAFKQDIVKKRYNNFEEVLDYCRRSANPVGRLILELFNIRSEEAFAYSDDICSALQITNFIQDTAIDYKNGRIYIPLDDIKKFDASENLFDLKEKNVNFIKLMRFETERVEQMFINGKNLIGFLRGRLKFEISWTLLGGLEILQKVKKNNYDVINHRPVLKKSDLLLLLFKALVLR